MDTPPKNPTLEEALKDMPPTNGATKVLFQEHRDNRNQLVATLFALYETSQIIGLAQRGVVTFGIEIQHTRFHLTQAAAVTCAKQMCRQYLGRDDVDFINEPPDPVVLQAPGMVHRDPEMPQRRM